MYVKDSVRNLVNEAEKQVKDQFEKIDDICEYNTQKVLEAF